MNKEFLLGLIEQSGKDGFQLVCVTKNRRVEEINKVISFGVSVIGENKVQEAKAKFGGLQYDCEKHLIGHLQTNKVKDAVRLFDCIHSVDSIKIARKISTESSLINKCMDVFVQINVSGEESKHGFSMEDFDCSYSELVDLAGVNVIGLMTMAPNTKNENKIRNCFSKLRELSVKYSIRNLSMGMSGDYDIALEEGATHIRIGSKIFVSKNH